MLVREKVMNGDAISAMFRRSVDHTSVNLIYNSMKTPGQVVAPLIIDKIRRPIERKLCRKYPW